MTLHECRWCKCEHDSSEFFHTRDGRLRLHLPCNREIERQRRERDYSAQARRLKLAYERNDLQTLLQKVLHDR